MEAKLSFEVEPGWHQAIAVDESVAKCDGGRPIYVWVGVDAYINEAANLVRSVRHSTVGTSGNALRFLRRLRRRCLSVWVTQSSSLIGVHGTVTL